MLIFPCVPRYKNTENFHTRCLVAICRITYIVNEDLGQLDGCEGKGVECENQVLVCHLMDNWKGLVLANTTIRHLRVQYQDYYRLGLPQSKSHRRKIHWGSKERTLKKIRRHSCFCSSELTAGRKKLTMRRSTSSR